MEKLCECGCGNKTNLATHTSKKACVIKGQPMRFIRGHNSQGRKIGCTAWNKGMKGLEIWGDITNHPRWIKDRNALKKEEQKYDHLYRLWMSSVKNRDGWRCKISNSDCSGRLEAHHILSWKDHPELRYDINNGITLCLAHHPRKRAEEKRLSPYFQEIVSVSK